MTTDIFLISNIVYWVANLIALTIAILFCYKDFNPRYLRIFPPYLFVSICVEILVNQDLNRFFNFRPFGDNQRFAKHVAYNLFTLFEVFIFSCFMYRIIRSVRIKKMLIVVLILFSLFFLRSSFPRELWVHSNDVAVNLESIIIIIPCLVYFKELFARPEPVDLLTEPSFWLVTGIFFYLATIFPLFLAGSYLIDHGMKKVAMNLYCINNFALTITYVLFIKGYTCRIKRL